MLLMGDWDGDDRIARDEAPEQIARQFDRLDDNADGFIDKDELMQMAQRQRQPRQNNPRAILSQLMTRDANGDGKISRVEAPDAVRQRFDRIDANGDGFIDRGEIQAMMRQNR